MGSIEAISAIDAAWHATPGKMARRPQNIARGPPLIIWMPTLLSSDELARLLAPGDQSKGLTR